MISRLVRSATVASMGVLALGGVASAHIDPDPAQAQAGARLTVGFTVEHGCDGSPTVRLDMRLPDGVTDPVPETVDGWEGTIDTVDGDTVVTFAGGSLADDVEGTFAVTMTVPRTPDTTIYFPFVQRCEVGEIRWIAIPAQPGEELDEPAPAMALIGPVASAPTTEASDPAATEPAPTDPSATEPAATDPVVTVAPTTIGSSSVTDATPDTTEPILISTGGDGSGDSSIGTIGFIVSVAAVLALGGFVVYRSRQARARNAPDVD